MKYLLIVSIFLCNASAASQCLLTSDFEKMYDAFFSISFVKSKSVGTLVFRQMTHEEKLTAFSCLENGAALGECRALKVLQLFHRHGFGADTFHFTPNLNKADELQELWDKSCKLSNK